MSRREFAPLAVVEPIAFGLAGAWFTCRDAPPVEAVTAVLELPELPAKSEPGFADAYTRQLGEIIDFLAAVVVDEDRVALLAAFTAGGVDDVTLVDVFEWVCIEYRNKIVAALPSAAGVAAVVPASSDDDPEGVLAGRPIADLEDVLAKANRFGGEVVTS